jgi:hypothetical protein
MRKVLLTLLILAMVSPCLAKYSGGTGTSADPYLIYAPWDLNAIGTNSADWGKSFKLMADIDIAAYKGTSFAIIGNSTTAFTGVFDGNGHSIRNFKYAVSGYYTNIGIFGVVRGTIKNVISANPSINCPQASYVGGLVGTLDGSGKLIKCAAINSSIAGYYYVGGLVGTLDENGQLTECAAIDGSVAGEYYVGGLVGSGTGDSQTSISKIDNCYSTCDVNGKIFVGGLVGESEGLISQCYSAGSVPNGFGFTYGTSGSGYEYRVTASYWDVNASGGRSTRAMIIPGLSGKIQPEIL